MSQAEGNGPGLRLAAINLQPKQPEAAGDSGPDKAPRDSGPDKAAGDSGPNQTPEKTAGDSGPAKTGGGLPAIRRTTEFTIPSRGLLSRASYADFLPDLEAVAEREHSPVARILVVAVAALFAIMVLWAGFAEVEKVATAQGTVRPAGRVKTVNHADGGTVRTILVREGDLVAKDQVLLTLSPDLIRGEVAKLTGEWQALSAEAVRLKAEAAGKPLNFPAELASARPDLVLAHTQLYEARRTAFESRRSAADQVVLQRRADTRRLKAQVTQLEDSLEVLVEQQTALGKLADKGFFPRLRYLSIKRQVSDGRGQLAQARESLKAATAALAEAIDRRDGLTRDTASDILTRLVAARRERDSTYRSLQQQRTRLNNLAVRAPVAGIVQNLKTTNVGQAFRPGEPMLTIVPTGDTLILDIQVSNNDIGYISVGQAAKVTILTYNPIKYGTLDGVVVQVAPDSFANKQTGELIFSVLVRTDKNYMGDFPGKFPVRPGMLASVDFQIGRRSILSYLTDRVIHTTSRAFKER